MNFHLPHMRTTTVHAPAPSWFVTDAAGKTLGRLAAQIAHVLRGKHKPAFAPHALHGDHVIVMNAAAIVLQGRKREEKSYVRHTGYLGHMKRIPVSRLLSSDPAQVLTRAVRGMLPRNRLRPRMLRRLHVYLDSTHTHLAQQPQPLDSLFTPRSPKGEVGFRKS